MNPPRLFSDKGELLDIDANKLPEPLRQCHEAIVKAHAANKQAFAEYDSAMAEVNAAIEGVRNTEEFYRAHFPTLNFHDLWRQNFGGGPANRKRAMGLTR